MQCSPYDSCFINAAQCFIHALYDLRLREFNFIIKIFIPLQYHFYSSTPNPCDIVSERAITHIVSKVLVLSCYSDSLLLRSSGSTNERHDAWVISNLTIFSGADSQFLLFSPRTHTIFIFTGATLLQELQLNKLYILFNTSLIIV